MIDINYQFECSDASNVIGLLDAFGAWQQAAATEKSGVGLFQHLQRFGVTMFNFRLYSMPAPGFGSSDLWREGGFLQSYHPDGWSQSAESKYVCLDCNPLIEAPKKRLREIRFSKLAPRETYGAYWEAWGRISTRDGIGFLDYAPNGRTASMAIGFADLEQISPAEVSAIRLVGKAMLQEILQQDALSSARPRITTREREVMALVASGLTESTIAGLLSISQTTVRAHADSVRTKLGASNRAEAVAIFVRLGLDMPDHSIV
jgi:LuxR family transcriptional regulator, quorum-sensing system regulator BjaR1